MIKIFAVLPWPNPSLPTHPWRALHFLDPEAMFDHMTSTGQRTMSSVQFTSVAQSCPTLQHPTLQQAEGINTRNKLLLLETLGIVMTT